LCFVTRLNENDTIKLSLDNNNNKLVKTRILVSPETDQAVRRSYNVMSIFIKATNDMEKFICDNLETILNNLFKIFLPSSSGNFHHFSKILEYLLINLPVETTKVLLSSSLLWTLLDFMHEAPIIDSLIAIFCCTFPRQNDALQFYRSLVDAKGLEKIGNKIYGKDQTGALAAAEFFVKLLEKLASLEMSGILFISLCRTSVFTDGLFSRLINKDGDAKIEQQKACALVLRELLIKSGEKLFDQASDFTKPLPNMLSSIHDKLHDYSKVYITDLCNVFIEMDDKKGNETALSFSSYSVKRPMGLYKFNLVEILCDIIVSVPSYTLDKIPGPLWRILSNWFLEYKHNNLYHVQFYKVIQVIIHHKHIPSQQNLFKYKFLSKVIEHYRSTELSDCRGFIILICNTIRLAADLQQPNEYLRHYLISHDLWKQFLPILKNDTLIQLKRYSEGSGVMLEEEEEEEEGADLGSSYALSLGFDAEPPPVIFPEDSVSKKKKKKKPKKKKVSAEQKQENSAEEKPQESPSWWTEMVTDFKKEEEAKGEQKAMWWEELKAELEQSSSTNKYNI